MSIVVLTSDNFDTVVAAHPFMCIDFWAPDCAPCKSFALVFEAVAKAHPEIAFASCNIAANLDIAEDFLSQSVPHLMILREQVAVFDESSSMDKASLEDLIAQAQALNMEDLRAQAALHTEE